MDGELEALVEGVYSKFDQTLLWEYIRESRRRTDCTEMKEPEVEIEAEKKNIQTKHYETPLISMIWPEIPNSAGFINNRYVVC